VETHRHNSVMKVREYTNAEEMTEWWEWRDWQHHSPADVIEDGTGVWVWEETANIGI
jgi:hypothetical protein